jgi:hypothetical protein
MHGFSATRLLFVLAIVAIGVASGLQCYYRTEGLHPTSEPLNSTAAQLKPYDCPKGDKYCVDLGGMLHVQNLTFSFKSCESEVKEYIDPISSKLGQKLRYDCATADGKPKDVGPLTYWYNCCGSDLCNGALSAFSSGLLFKITTAGLMLFTLRTVFH